MPAVILFIFLLPVLAVAEFDPKTVWFCPEDGTGAEGISREPPGRIGNEGTGPFDALPDLGMLGERDPGTDVRLCEGGVFEDQSLKILHGADIGDVNRLVVERYRKERIAERDGKSGQYTWAYHNGLLPEPNLFTNTLVDANEIWKQDGWDMAAVDRVVVGCYRLERLEKRVGEVLHIGYKPVECSNPAPRCKLGIEVKCVDPLTGLLYRSYSHYMAR